MTPPRNAAAVRTLARISAGHSVVFAALLVCWLVPGLATETAILGWAHGFLWIGISLVVAQACRRRLLPWSQLTLVSVVGVFLGPFAGTWGFTRALREAPV